MIYALGKDFEQLSAQYGAIAEKMMAYERAHKKIGNHIDLQSAAYLAGNGPMPYTKGH